MPNGNEEAMAKFRAGVIAAYLEGVEEALVQMVKDGKITEADRIAFMEWFIARPRQPSP